VIVRTLVRLCLLLLGETRCPTTPTIPSWARTAVTLSRTARTPSSVSSSPTSSAACCPSMSMLVAIVKFWMVDHLLYLIPFVAALVGPLRIGPLVSWRLRLHGRPLGFCPQAELQGHLLSSSRRVPRRVLLFGDHLQWILRFLQALVFRRVLGLAAQLLRMLRFFLVRVVLQILWMGAYRPHKPPSVGALSRIRTYRLTRGSWTMSLIG
jgi:hypothetical protein